MNVLPQAGRPSRVSLPLATILALVGASAVVAQVVLLRELMVAFGGNEMAIGLALAIWLLWTALGSGLLSRLAPPVNAQQLVALLQAMAALLLPCTILVLRLSRAIFHALPGEVLGPVPFFLTSLVGLSGFCSVSGWLFAAGARLLAQVSGRPGTNAVGSMYLLEAAGSAAGGILASLVLLPWLDSFQIALLVGVANLMAAASLVLPRRSMQLAACALLALLLPVFLVTGRHLDRRTLAAQWPGFRVLDSANSRYGSLLVLENENGRTLAENGLPVVSVPDPQAAEETVHFALLQHPAPRSLLLIGGGLNGSLPQALRHPTMNRVDYVELDPEILRLSRERFPAEWAATNDSRVRVHSLDGRLFLKTTAQRFDVIIVSLPDPQTAQLNRFYTQEFFQQAAARLTPGGILSFQLHASENYISPELAKLLRCLRATLRQTFADTLVIPGDTAVFLASTRAAGLTSSPDHMMSRLRSRHLQTAYVREYYLPFRMAPDRMADLEQQLAAQPDTQVNRDLVPIAYYFDVVLWSGQFSGAYRQLFTALAAVPLRRIMELAVLLMVVAAGLLPWRRAGARRATAAFCVAAMGFTLLALEILLLLGFQAIYGYVYHQLAVIIAAFMAGMALGSWLSLRWLRQPVVNHSRTEMRWLGITQILALLSPLLLYFALAGLASAHSLSVSAAISNAVFPLVALLAGALGGFQFPAANRIYFDEQTDARPGTLYALDLAGACAAALLISAYLVPVFGFLRTSELIALVNLLPLAMVIRSMWPARSRA